MNARDQILVPVDLGPNAAIALDRAALIASTGTSVIHLLHVSGKHTANAYTHKPGIHNGYAKELVHHYSTALKRSNPGLQIVTTITYGKVEEQIIRFANSTACSLVILSKSRYHNIIPYFNTIHPTHIVKNVPCSVLLLNNKKETKHSNTIIVPLEKNISDHETNLLLQLNIATHPDIHLVTVLDRQEYADNVLASAVLSAMKRIKENMQCNIRHMILYSNNKNKALLQYAEKVNAGLLVMDKGDIARQRLDRSPGLLTISHYSGI